MSDSPFCKMCGKRVEWHLTESGKNMPIDAEPSEHGRFVFGPGLRLKLVDRSTPTTKRRYECHWDTSPRCKPAPRPPRACFRCGSTDHLVADCPED